MTPTEEFAVAISVEVVLLAIAWGLALRSRWHLCWAFAAYIPVVLVGNIMVTWWPKQFHIYWFWMGKQIAYDVLKLGIALEVAWRTFRIFPGARATVRRVVLLILGVTTALVLAAPLDSSGSWFLTMSGHIQPRVVNGTTWILAATMGLAFFYRVPLHPFHTGLISSLAAYLAVFGTLLRLEGIYGWAAQPYLNALDPAAYLLLTCWWARIVWRPDSEVALAHAEVLRKLELRAASCG
jgi:hypothetical protein